MGINMFVGATRLSNVTIRNGCTVLGDSCFQRCTALKTIILPDSVASVGTYSVFDGSGLEEIQIGTSDSQLADIKYALHKAYSLKKIVIHKSTKLTISGFATAGCGIPYPCRNYNSTTQTSSSGIDTNGNGKLYVPNALVSTYKADSIWGLMVSDSTLTDYDGDANGRIYAIENMNNN